jgi:DNA-binding transcriptional MerR regulator
MDKSPDAFRTIREVAESMELPQHVLRFWETRFPQIKPLKRGGGRRYYRPDDVELLRSIKHLLYGEGYTIKGVQKLIKEQGARAVAAGAPNLLTDGAAYSDRAPVPTSAAQESDEELDHRSYTPSPASSHRDAESLKDTRKSRRCAIAPDDYEALNSALRDIVEGERILALALGNSPG